MGSPRHEKPATGEPVEAGLGLDLVPDPVLVIGMDGLVQRVNAAAAALFGHAEPGLIGSDFRRLVHAEDWPPMEAALARAALDGGQDPVEARVLARSGGTPPMEWRWARAEGSLIAFGRHSCGAGESAGGREHRAPVGIFQTDAQGRCIYANERWLQMTGYDFAQVAGDGWWTLVVPEDRQEAQLRWRRMAEQRGSFRMEFRVRRKEGMVVWVLGEAVPERDHAGRSAGYIGSMIDINQVKLNELELRNYREHLEEMVRERTIELEALNRELEAFSYSVSHDLRAPLRAISGFNGALIDEYGQQLDENARFFLRRIQANTRQMGQLIDDMLELSKVTQAELQRQWVDLSRLADEIITELRFAEPERLVEVSVAPNLKVYGDPQLLAIMLQNLLGNAWKYTGRNAGAAKIEFGATEVAGGPVFFVRDNGAGFDMSCAPHLFRAFHRLHDSTQFEGTGIGLATVHRIVARHGGRVWAEAEEGNGATFFFVVG